MELTEIDVHELTEEQFHALCELIGEDYQEMARLDENPILIGLILSSLVFDVVQKKFGPKTASAMRAVYYFPQLLPIGACILALTVCLMSMI